MQIDTMQSQRKYLKTLIKYKNTLFFIEFQEIRKCLSLLFDLNTLLTPWGLHEVILRLIPFVYISDLPRDIFIHNFFRLALTNNLYLVHTLLTVKMNFPEIFSSGYQTVLLMQVLRAIKDSTM